MPDTPLTVDAELIRTLLLAELKQVFALLDETQMVMVTQIAVKVEVAGERVEVSMSSPSIYVS